MLSILISWFSIHTLHTLGTWCVLKFLFFHLYIKFAREKMYRLVACWWLWCKRIEKGKKSWHFLATNGINHFLLSMYFGLDREIPFCFLFEYQLYHTIRIEIVYIFNTQNTISQKNTIALVFWLLSLYYVLSYGVAIAFHLAL